MGQWQYKGTNGEIERGYGVKIARTTPETNQRNGLLINQNGDHISLWIVDVAADFELAGTSAQSARKRDFYARNFVQPRLRVQGISGDSAQYQKLAEFIRDAQMKAILYGDHQNVKNPTMELTVFGGGWSDSNLRNTKGRTRTIKVQGYIESIERGAKRFEFSPEWTFDFVISKAVSWLVNDETVNARKLKAWNEFIKKDNPNSLATRDDDPYEDDPDLPERQAGLLNEAFKPKPPAPDPPSLTDNPFTGAPNSILGRRP